MQEVYSKTPHASACQSDTRIFPVSESLHRVDVFICNIRSSRITYVAVNNCYFLMISVIHIKVIYNRLNHVKCCCFYAIFCKFLVEILRQTRYAAKIIIQYAYFHTFGNFLLKHTVYFLKGVDE